MNFEEWFLQLQNIFQEQAGCIMEDPDPFLDSFADGQTPQEAFDVEVSYWGE